jgi:aspartyl-tRNA(Asn)/glutamyl-tRNA(Gln) amidotransferase subunit A
MLPSGYTLTSAAQALAAEKLSAVELTQSYLQQIRGLNHTLNAYVTVFEEQALTQARQSDERRREGKTASVLDGIPLAIKDNILVQGTITTAGSAFLAKYVAPYDASVTTKLKQAGAIFLGKTNMDEYAMGGSTEHSAFGPTKHPRDLSRVPGGSSGGSACAVAADLCVAALGSDTGGSIRQPASFCGLVGFKPSYGRVSRYGLIAMASSFDQIGPMTKTVEDAALLQSVIEGADTFDQTTATLSPTCFETTQLLQGVRIGLPRQAWGAGMSDEVRTHTMRGIEQMRALGAEIKEVDLPYADEALAVYYVLMPCEVSANLSRLDGMRYGERVLAGDLMSTYQATRAHGFGAEVKRRILLGTYALSKGYYDAYYRQARKVRRLIADAYEETFREVDLLVTPTAPNPAFRLGEKVNDPLAMYLEDIFTVGVNVAGLPAISVPCGDHEGLPIGLQLIGRRFDDGRVLSLAHTFEKAFI